MVAENVDAVLNKLNIGEFRRWIVMLSELGYTSSYRIMNAKDYGTPQNRRRMFMVSTLTHGSFVFPKPCPDGRILRDVLEEDVDESYFLSEKRLATFEKHRKRNEANGNKFGWRVHVLDNEEREREREGTCPRPSTPNQTGTTRPSSQFQGGIDIKGTLGKPTQHNTVFGSEGIAPTLARCDYKDPIKIIMEERQ